VGGAVVVTGSRDTTVGIWRPAEGTGMRLGGHTADVTACLLGGDATYICSAGADHTIRIWDVDRGTEQGMLPVLGGVGALALSEDGTMLALGDDGGNVYLADLLLADKDTAAGKAPHADSLPERPRTSPVPTAPAGRVASPQSQAALPQTGPAAAIACPHCGAQIPPDTLWCPLCGRKLP